MKTLNELQRLLVTDAKLDYSVAELYINTLSDFAKNKLFEQYVAISQEISLIEDDEERLNKAILHWQIIRKFNELLTIDNFYLDIETLISMLYLMQSNEDGLIKAKKITVRYTKLNPITVIIFKRLGQVVDVKFSF